MTSDDLPIIGPAPGLKNLMLATGHGMLGMSMSAVTGQLIADMITRQTPHLDVSPYRAGRF